MRLAIAGLAAVVSLAGCGSTSSSQATTVAETPRAPPPRPAPVSASGASEASATVGPAGGTLSLTNGARLEIPEGALSEPIEVSFSQGVDGQAFADAETQRPLGPMLTAVPGLAAESASGFTVSIPRMSIPSGFEESDLAFAMEEVDDDQRAIDVLGTQTRWQFYPVRVVNDRFVATVTGLPGHRLHFGVAR